jgi:tryptophanyl-tRNA synthetase
MKPRLFSGIQPSGDLHLGNYLGMLKNSVELQNNYESLFCIVDLHAITVPQEPEKLRQKIIELTKHYLTAGIDPTMATLFIQSSVSEHAELTWVLNCLTKTGEMERMIQFKDKSKKKGQENVSVGLFDYPVLMAADILLYDTAVVPVGEDQTQHLELTNTLARRFNNRFGQGQEIFTQPKPLIKSKDQGSRIMALDDPTQKMSKSADSPNSAISLTDTPDNAAKKISRATTDSGSEIKFAPDKPGVSNLLTIYSLLSQKPTKELEVQYQGQGYGDFKKDLAVKVAEFLTEYQEKFNNFDDNTVAQILAQGAKKAKEIAHQKMFEVKKAVGLG